MQEKSKPVDNLREMCIRDRLFHPGDLDYIHSVERISKLSNVISINGGVQLDLMGQELSLIHI